MTLLLLTLALIVLVVAGFLVVKAADDKSNPLMFVAIGIGLLALPIAGSALYFGPLYHVWQQGLQGQAELRRAEQNRQIRIEEAGAKLESSKLEAKAEVEIAKGAAEANQIMAKSIGGPDNYLRWKYINMLSEKADDNRTIIYVPTEANIPILEAGRLTPGR